MVSVLRHSDCVFLYLPYNRRSAVIEHDGREIGHFTVMGESEGEGDLVLIQTFFALLWKLFLKNTS